MHESMESNERISPIIAVDGVGKVLLVSGEDSSITSIISVSVRLSKLTFETNETESIVLEVLELVVVAGGGAAAAAAAGGDDFVVAAEDDGRKSFVTDSEAVTIQKKKKKKRKKTNMSEIEK